MQAANELTGTCPPVPLPESTARDRQTTSPRSPRRHERDRAATPPPPLSLFFPSSPPQPPPTTTPLHSFPPSLSQSRSPDPDGGVSRIRPRGLAQLWLGPGAQHPPPRRSRSRSSGSIPRCVPRGSDPPCSSPPLGDSWAAAVVPSCFRFCSVRFARKKEGFLSPSFLLLILRRSRWERWGTSSFSRW